MNKIFNAQHDWDDDEFTFLISLIEDKLFDFICDKTELNLHINKFELF